MRFLFTTFEGGGHVAPAITFAARLQARGHEVLFVSDEANQAAAERAGLAFRTWRRAPNRSEGGRADDPLQDWRHIWPPAVVKAVCKAVMTGPAEAYALDARELISDFQPDVVVSNELLLGVAVAAEATGTPLAFLSANVWSLPTRADTPPFGPGFAPARTNFEQRREQSARGMIAGFYDVGLADLNRSRAALDLRPLAHVMDQIDAARLIVLATSAAFDFGDAPPPEPFVYCGPLLEQPAWADDGSIEHLVSTSSPNVLISFSTTFQDQRGVMARCIKALSRLPVHGIVTTGPAVQPGDLPSASNVVVVRSAPHDRLVPRCAAVISHGGHGTLLRPLLHGVPVVCVSMGRDHPENARRLTERGAGLRVSRWSSASTIRRAAARVLNDPAFTNGARRLSASIKALGDESEPAMERLETLAQRSRRV